MTTGADQVDLFFRRHPSTPIPTNEARAKLRVADVPQTEEGLMMLARGENWSAVAQLAEMMEKQVTTVGFDGKEKRLKLVQVRLTAAIKLQDYEKADRIVDSVGGVEVLKSSEMVVTGSAAAGGGADPKSPTSTINPHVDPDTGRSVVPFSLVFLATWISLKKADTKDQGLQNMYDLLDDCAAQEKNAQSSTAPSPNNTATMMAAIRWRERQRRVRRALVMTHFERHEFEPAVMHLNTLVDMASDITEQMLLMQQVGCLALRCGNSVVANEAFTKMKHLLDGCDEEEATPKAKFFCSYLAELNETMTCMFFGEYDVAVEKLRKLMMIHPFTGEPCDEGGASNNNSFASRSNIEDGGAAAAATSGGSFGKPPALIGPTPYNVMAANGFIVCHQYASDETRYTLKSAVQAAEAIIKRHPQLAMRNNGVLYNIKALHNLEDDQTLDKGQLMKNVIDMFRCGPECNMDSIVP